MDLVFPIFFRIQRRSQHLQKTLADEKKKRQQLETAALTAEETAAELERLHSSAEKQRDIIQWELDKVREAKFKKEHQHKKLSGNFFTCGFSPVYKWKS